MNFSNTPKRLTPELLLKYSASSHGALKADAGSNVASRLREITHTWRHVDPLKIFRTFAFGSPNKPSAKNNHLIQPNIQSEAPLYTVF